jgi:hypothetical protein
LEDEKEEGNWKDILNYNWHTYFTWDSALQHAEKNWKRIPTKDDWKKILRFLPWDNKNAMKFITDVLWLSFAGWYFNSFDDQSNFAYYWTSTVEENQNNPFALIFKDKFIMMDYNKKCGFSLRCLKN